MLIVRTKLFMSNMVTKPPEIRSKYVTAYAEPDVWIRVQHVHRVTHLVKRSSIRIEIFKQEIALCI